MLLQVRLPLVLARFAYIAFRGMRQILLFERNSESAMALEFNTQFDPRYGEPIQIADRVRRLTANNPGPFTFHGTNTYLVGKRSLAVVDPGPDDDSHLSAILRAAGNAPITHIFVSHTHRDHSPLAARLQIATGATVLAEGGHRTARPLRAGETNPLDSSADYAFSPEIALTEGSVIDGEDWALRTVLTPGHTANHAAFAFEESGILFSADHVMAWSTSIVAPPDGSMGEYMRSMEKLIEREDRVLLPGHGGAVLDPLPFLQGLREHRLARERAVVERLAMGDRTIGELVSAIYLSLDPSLRGAAALSILAHLEDLVQRGLVIATDLSKEGAFELV